MNINWRRITSVVLLIAMTTSMLAMSRPAYAGDATEDLKQIEYRYYFRGRYQQAIEALQTYLARVDLKATDTLRAREVLAASYVLGGAPAMGKEVFSQVIMTDPEYPGPDPTVFKLEVVNAYAEARAEYAARMLKTVPAQDPALAAAANDPAPAEPAGKPIYKKWWFYAGAAVALLAVGAAAGSGGDGDSPAASTGTVVVGVRVQ
ncbi:MAG: hypothetical protein OEX18_14300 [Candidatus Krumholzibacteria bacterium]|nr:hypothetical protein [Candidatus Krumholzibacteria bacterium]MDH5628155.1 hypothetical protein [Candidatus Krumholzibacteria bacterium]